MERQYSVADPGFSPGGAPTPKIAIIFHIFAENCMKMKEFGPPGGRAFGAPLGSANDINIIATNWLRFDSEKFAINNLTKPPVIALN